MAEDRLERDGELGAVERLLDEAADGEGRVVLLEGPAGIGKTRLLAESRRLGAATGMRVLAARSSELEREFPYGVVRQLFEPLLADRQPHRHRPDPARRDRRRHRRPLDPAPAR